MSETEGFAEPDGMSALREALETAQAGEVPEDAPLPAEPAMDLLEAAWGIIASAGEGDWDSQRPEWREAAVRWRDRYHVMLRAFCAQDRELTPAEWAELSDAMGTGVVRIATERQRQVAEEGWTAEHDARHVNGELARAAACYALAGARHPVDLQAFADIWPWKPAEWKPDPEDAIRNLVKAGALVAAEIDRLSAAVEAT